MLEKRNPGTAPGKSREDSQMESLLYYESPIGLLRLRAEDAGLCGIDPVRSRDDAEQPGPLLRRAAGQLDEYFAGTRRDFDLPLALHGTPFQRRVWAALLAIPYGETRSYRDIARAVGSPRACRAVGMANHANPVMIVVPCHRVICADGSLGGYGGGQEAKKCLLALETHQNC